MSLRIMAVVSAAMIVVAGFWSQGCTGKSGVDAGYLGGIDQGEKPEDGVGLVGGDPNGTGEEPPEGKDKEAGKLRPQLTLLRPGEVPMDPAVTTAPLAASVRVAFPAGMAFTDEEGRAAVAAALSIEPNVAATLAWNDDGTALTLTPVQVLAPSRRYVVTLEGFALGEHHLESAELEIKTLTPGDIDGDGRPEIIVGSRGFDNFRGAGYVFSIDELGEPTLLARIEGEHETDKFGHAAVMAGDLDADGMNDIVVSGEGWPKNESKGAVYIFNAATLLDAGGTSDAVLLSTAALKGDAEVQKVGNAVIPLGDVNCDGFDDLGISMSIGQAGAGAIRIVSGASIARGAAEPLTTIMLPKSGAFAANTGDLDGDGHAEIIVGSMSSDDGKALFLFRGRDLAGDMEVANAAAEITVTGGVIIDGESSTPDFMTMPRGRDLDGDDIPDLVFGGLIRGEPPRGAVFIFRGAQLLNAMKSDTKTIRANHAMSIITLDGLLHADRLAWAGDADGNGTKDFLVSANYFNGDENSNMAYLFSGEDLVGAWRSKNVAFMGENGLPLPGLDGFLSPAVVDAEDARAVIEAPQAISNWFGGSVADVGDLDGDGRTDHALGSASLERVFLLMSEQLSLDQEAGTVHIRAEDLPQIVAPDDAANWFGYSVGGAGDVVLSHREDPR